MSAYYLPSARKQFTSYKLLGEKAMEQLQDEDLFWQYNAESNSIAVIVQHLWGNMRSRWTDFLSSDGEKPWRDRDAEFEQRITTRAELLRQWHEGWQTVFHALDALQEEDLSKTVFIRSEGLTVVDAVNRQLAHYAYHIGQIVSIGKMRAAHWASLSIPRGGSVAYNAERFAAPGHQ